MEMAMALGGVSVHFCRRKYENVPEKFATIYAKVHPHTHRSQQPQTSDLKIDADGTFPSKVNQLDCNMSVKSSISNKHGLRFVHLLAYLIGTFKH